MNNCSLYNFSKTLINYINQLYDDIFGYGNNYDYVNENKNDNEYYDFYCNNPNF